MAALDDLRVRVKQLKAEIDAGEADITLRSNALRDRQDELTKLYKRVEEALHSDGPLDESVEDQAAAEALAAERANSLWKP